MSKLPSIVTVSAAYGMSETFWDIYFQPGQLAYADVEDEDRRHISVFIDPVSGALTLNNGYEPGSPPYKDENRLFAEFEDAIIETLSEEVPNAPEYAVFLQGARDSAIGRRERLIELAGALNERNFDF